MAGSDPDPDTGRSPDPGRLRVTAGAASHIEQGAARLAEQAREHLPRLALERRRLELAVVPVGDAVVAGVRRHPDIEAIPRSSTRTIFAASMPVRSVPSGATAA